MTPYLNLVQTISATQGDFDEYGTELGPEARVWKTYVKEADRFDAEKVEEWNKCVLWANCSLGNTYSNRMLYRSLDVILSKFIGTRCLTILTNPISDIVFVSG